MSGSIELNADAIVSRTGTVVKRPIPVLRMYSNTSVNIPNLTTTNITFTTVDTDCSVADTGFTYANGRFTNNTSGELIVHVCYGITYTTNTTSTRISWIQIGTQSGRYGQVGTAGANLEPSVSGAGVMRVPAGSYIMLQVYQNTGLTLQAVATGYFSPWLQITII